MKPIIPTKEHARKIIELVGFGLVSGLGVQEPGKMCVEAAVNCALGLPHADNPPCVGSAVCSFKIALNDCSWSSNEARGEGMKRLAVAQLGSDQLDQKEFGELMYLRGTQRILSFIFEHEAEEHPAHKEKYLALAKQMRNATSFSEARSVAKDAYASAYAYTYASAYAYTHASAHAYTHASASASASAYASASASASAFYKKDDLLLNLIAQVGLDVLIEMESPGRKWLPLCEEVAA